MATKLVSGQTGALHVDDGGTGGLPVIFLHSYAGSGTHWYAQLAHTRTERRALAIDLRGHGESDTPANGDYAIEAIADDVESVARAFALERFVLVGHSIGGAVAIAYAGRHPEKVAGLLLVGTPGKLPDEQVQQIMSAMEADYEKVTAAYWARLLEDAQPYVDARIREEIGSVSRNESMSIFRATFAFDPVAPLSAYHGPRLAVVTSHAETPYDLHKLVPDLPHTSVSGTSHWLHMDSPQEFNVIMDEFLEKVEVEEGVQ